MKTNLPQPKIIFFDIDDTLYIKDEQRIADSTRQALKALHERGIITAIATGRSPVVFPAPISALIEETGIDMLVSINGQFVRYRGEALAEFPMDKQEVAEIGAYFAAHNVVFACVSDRKLSVSGESEGMLRAMRALNLRYEINPLHAQEEPVYQMLAFYNEAAAETLEAGLPGDVKTVRWHEDGIDLLARSGSKARGIQAALQQLGLQMSDAMAFGDGLNDMEMMQAVGFGVAMGNAQPDLKAVADYVCPSVTEDGIYRGLVELGVLD